MNKEDLIYRGIFWIVDFDCLEKNDEYFIKILTDREGNVLSNSYPLTSRKGDDYNHKLTWNELPPHMTKRKPYNYYPRGRVQIKNGKCTIYINPLLNTEVIQNYIINQFRLNCFREENSLKIIVDYSEHYQARRN